MADHDETVALPPTPAATPPPSSHPNRFAPGQLLAGRYRIVSMLGKGGMGEVYRADDLTLGQSVALKFLPVGAATERFRNEVKIARQVSHPNVCRVYDVADVDGQWFLSMEYVDGEDLGSLLRRIGRLPADKALEIARKLCAGLAAAHEKGVLHRDLKPGNVMLDGRGQVLLTDFGLAAVAGEVEGHEISSGTPAYMAPEQLAGREVTVRSDIYSLGLVIYEVFTGKQPYESDTLAGLQKKRSEATPASMTSLVRDLDPLVERVILRCLDPDPARRPSSAIAVAAALPGGDPLAAALAVGETPSPQMVAAAGEGRGLKPKFAIPVLLFAVAGVIGNAVLVSDDSALKIMRPEYSPDVLQVKARDILDKLGYGGRPADSAYGFDWNDPYLKWVGEHEKPVKWQQAVMERPSGYVFWYRQSPYPLTATQFHSDLLTPGIVDFGDPVSTLSGMADVILDAQGRLSYLKVVPLQREPPLAAPVTADWNMLFAAAGLDKSQFQDAAPEWSFLAASDERKAWTGIWPGTKRPLRVEAAAWRGKAVGFQLIADWTKPSRMPPLSDSSGQGRFIVILLLTVVVMGGSALLACRNLALGKGDRKGAMRLATIVFATLMAIWICNVHVVASAGLLGMFFIALATAVAWSAFIWMIYMALEPFVRRYWPQSIISWSSIGVGNWRDPIVGRDVVAGIALGISWRLIDRALDFVHPGTTPDMVQTSVLEGFRATAGALTTKSYYGIRSALVFFFLLFVMRILLRKQWLAAVSFVVLWSMMAALGNDNFWVAWGVNALVYVLIAVAVVRLGLLALALAVFTADAALLTGGLYGGGWYVSNSVFCIAVMVALAIWGCWTAMAGNPLWKSELLD